MKNKKLINSFKYAFKGIVSALLSERNMKIHVNIMALVIIFGLILNISVGEWFVCIICFAIVISAEMFNTAFEQMVDIAMPEKDPRAKFVKDVAAGGVVITAINALIVAYFLFFDKISDIGLNFIKNIVTSPIHLAFAAIVIVVIAIIALIAIARINKHKGLNHKFMPSGFTTLAFAANTIIWLMMDSITNNEAISIVILTLSLVLSILVAASRIEAKAHKVSEVIFSACVGIIIVLVIYGVALEIAGI